MQGFAAGRPGIDRSGIEVEHDRLVAARRGRDDLRPDEARASSDEYSQVTDATARIALLPARAVP
ncbi:hypothetical protein [Streptomyces sp. NPDC001970]